MRDVYSSNQLPKTLSSSSRLSPLLTSRTFFAARPVKSVHSPFRCNAESVSSTTAYPSALEHPSAPSYQLQLWTICSMQPAPLRQPLDVRASRTRLITSLLLALPSTRPPSAALHRRCKHSATAPCALAPPVPRSKSPRSDSGPGSMSRPRDTETTDFDGASPIYPKSPRAAMFPLVHTCTLLVFAIRRLECLNLVV